ncbi:MAG: hypothetical protein JWO89_3212 [Verrucomicrobiaceae bacterium]|nr:hypothetical protein [Verrucomicrobiaceae bacterium]MDB6118402.1 hypothetical protein [Verrucomicrobiaceae bacterium]
MSAAIPSVVQLERAIKIAQKIQKLEAELSLILGQPGVTFRQDRDESAPRFTGKRKYTFSAETLAKRNAKKGADDSEGAVKPKKKVKMSAEGRAAIVAAQKARWAKTKEAANGSKK